ncbi:hypothetical protein [Bradyrhizobium sp. 21]|uniref:hypothetical protein n=1 Tax=Bradyrhizobium sp. 21 TaxID=2782666 RepID=UPI001FF72FAA|nr:hypothetical protein [Bradyrhizobium sp. 21]MCK1388918.1 hypothetical protein [Bradyrhizobium sp. 21]
MNFFIAFSLAAGCGAAMNSGSTLLVPQERGTCAIFSRCPPGAGFGGEKKVPVLILWAVPAILVVGGGIYLIGHMH